MHINYRVYIKILGFLTSMAGLGMLPCVAVGMHFEEWSASGSLFFTSIVCISIGFVVLTQLRTNKISLRFHEGWLIACVSWVYCSVIGAVPFYF